MEGPMAAYELHDQSQIPSGPVGYHVVTSGTTTTQIQINRFPAKPPLVENLLICVRELFGTAIFVLVGCMGSNNATTQGLIYMVLQACAEISSAGGLHLNPVISMAVATAGKIKTPLMVIPMILAQFAGCLLGAGFYRGIQTKKDFFRTGSERYTFTYTFYEIASVEETKDLFQYCFGELLCTCVLVTVFLRLFPLTTKAIPTNKKALKEIQMRKYIHALFVGLTMVALRGGILHIHFIGVMNPFQAFGPMAILVAEVNRELDLSAVGFKAMWKGHWVYWVGPLIGAITAAGIERSFKMFCPSKENDEDNSTMA